MSISQHSLPGPMPAMNQVTGVCDWDFLCPPGMEPDPNDDISKRPSLEEFDGELAIFQVNSDIPSPHFKNYIKLHYVWESLVLT